ncbi:hypothetical protein M9H77_27790 [Catharanthus roseus]|uniref:Uncharacterized protein n=1 Tax=Catharanthus roseus TaxID=4058 RepID=A0ACC0AG72_CATRO|nr:hypothetical protein M9H77_27790 [Catharanthus roseus]
MGGIEEGLLSESSEDIRVQISSSVTPAVVFSTFVAACGSLSYGFAIGYSSPAESGIMDDLGLSIAEYSVFGSILTFGGMMGALVSGRVADIVGRRIVSSPFSLMFIRLKLQLSVFEAVNNVASGNILHRRMDLNNFWEGYVANNLSCLKNALWLDIGRLSMGIGAGLHCYVAPIYIAEITPKHIRGAFAAIATVTVTFGFSLMFFIGNFIAWRMLAIVGALPCVIHIICLFLVPESPRWLAMVGKETGVEASLQFLRAKSDDIYSEAAQIKVRPYFHSVISYVNILFDIFYYLQDYTMTIQQQPQSRFCDLFDRKYAHPLIVRTDGFSSFASSVFKAAGFSVGIGSSVMAVIQLPSATVSVLLMDKLGRRPLLMVTAAGSCIGCILTSCGFLFQIYSASFSAGMGGTPWVIMSEIFPINIKGTGGSLVTLGNWFSSWIVTYAFNFLFQWSSAGVFFVFAAVCSLIIVFVVKLGQRSVDEEATDPLLDRSMNPCSEEDSEKKQSIHATPMVILSTFVAVLGSYVFGTAIGFSSPAECGIMRDLSLSLAQYSLFGSILTIGAMIGAVMSGNTADFLGRRAAMGFAETFCVIGWLAILFAKNALLLDIGRFSVGYGIGVISYVVPVYVAEITPPNLRGAFTAANQLMICIGSSVMFVIGNFLSWRTLALSGVIACLLQIIGLFIIPESPRWLAKINRWKDCETSLQRLRGEDSNVSEEAAEIREYTETLQRISETRLMDLFQLKYAHALIVGVGLMVLQQFGGVNAIAYYASAIFELAGFSGKTGTLAMVVIQVPMQVMGTLLMDKSGRRPLLMISAAGTCLGCFLVALSFLLQGLEVWKSSPFLAFLGVLIFTGSFSIGVGAIPWIIMSEIFPINVKGVAGSLVTVVNWLGSWIISYSFNFLTQWISSQGTFLMFSIVSGFTVLFVAKLVPETKGRTLEEIQASMVLFSRRER